MLTDTSASASPVSVPSSPHPPTPSSPHPPLSSRDRRLLRCYFNHNLNLSAVAREENEDPLDLLEWADRPEIAERMDKMHAHRARAVEAAEQEGRILAIDALKEMVRSSKDPIERRRAASTLMRRYDSLLRPRPRGGDSIPRPDGDRSYPRPEGNDRPGAPRGYKPLEVSDLDSRPGGPTSAETPRASVTQPATTPTPPPLSPSVPQSVSPSSSSPPQSPRGTTAPARSLPAMASAVGTPSG